MKGVGASNQIITEIKTLMKYISLWLAYKFVLNCSVFRYHHPNILGIMGFCYSPKIKAIVYRYIENGSLHSWIHNSVSKSCISMTIMIHVLTVPIVTRFMSVVEHSNFYFKRCAERNCVPSFRIITYYTSRY